MRPNIARIALQPLRTLRADSTDVALRPSITLGSLRAYVTDVSLRANVTDKTLRTHIANIALRADIPDIALRSNVSLRTLNADSNATLWANPANITLRPDKTFRPLSPGPDQTLRTLSPVRTSLSLRTNAASRSLSPNPNGSLWPYVALWADIAYRPLYPYPVVTLRALWAN